LKARAQKVSLGRSHPVVGWLGRKTLLAAAHLPLRGLLALGGALGSTLAVLPTQARSRSLTNLGLCLPELTEGGRKRISRRALAAMGGMVLETGWLWQRDREQLIPLAKTVHGQEHLDEALRQGKGVILAMPHLGSWEFLCLYISALHPLTSMFRPSRVREMDALLCAGRGHLGAQLVPAGTFAVRSLRRALGRGECVVILPDTDPKIGQSVFAPFFGVLANTGTLISRLAKDTDATVLTCFAERLPKGRGYDLHFEPAHPDVSHPDSQLAVTRLNENIEALIRRRPEQYLWRYRRFKRRPNDEPSFYKR
jgi:KDO2-lipid IV(A) lauroyltransferase